MKKKLEINSEEKEKLQILFQQQQTILSLVRSFGFHC
jgi:hypothetical protein